MQKINGQIYKKVMANVQNDIVNATEVLEKLDLNEDLKRSFWDYLDIFSIWMLNTPED